MSSINRGFLILSFLLILSISSVFAQKFNNKLLNTDTLINSGQTTLATEKAAYASGETVIINGAGFGSFEDVSLSVESYNESLNANVVLVRWNVYADKSGAFNASIPFDSLTSADGKYIVKAVGSESGAISETIFTNVVLAIGVNIEQCANGPLSAPAPCNTSSANDGYTRGNLVASKSHYREGDFVPIRIVADGLVAGQSYTVMIGYDFTKSGKFATDYLGDYDATESVNNNPCIGVAGCTLASEQPFGIPVDPQVTRGFDGILGTADDITQTPGSISCFGCTVTGFSAYSLSGATTGDSSKSFTLTFTANSSTVVIAYGSHISTRANWGVANSAINISGSPYHNYIVEFPGSNQGNRDLQLSAEAVIFPATIRIIKDAQPNSCLDFGFSTTGQVATSFMLDDDAGLGCADNTLSNSFDITGLTLFGSTNTVTVTEGAGVGGFNLTNISCQSFANGGGATINNNTINVPLRSATIQLEEGELVVCTYINSIVTAANVSAAGRVMDAYGNAISRASVTIQNAATGEMRTVLTNSFGYYRFDELPAGNLYTITVAHKRYAFDNPSQVFQLEDAIDNINFVASPE